MVLSGVMAVITLCAMAVCVIKADDQNRKIMYLLSYRVFCKRGMCPHTAERGAGRFIPRSHPEILRFPSDRRTCVYRLPA